MEININQNQSKVPEVVVKSADIESNDDIGEIPVNDKRIFRNLDKSLFSNERNVKCIDSACPSSQLCTEHRCSYSFSCRNEKLENVSPFCADHSCKKCVALNCCIISPVTRNKTSITHKLIDRFCSGINKSKKPCLSKKIYYKIDNKFYCGDHKPVKL